MSNAEPDIALAHECERIRQAERDDHITSSQADDLISAMLREMADRYQLAARIGRGELDDAQLGVRRPRAAGPDRTGTAPRTRPPARVPGKTAITESLRHLLGPDEVAGRVA